MVFCWYFFILPLILSDLFKNSPTRSKRGAGPPGTAPRCCPRKAGHTRERLSESNRPWQGAVGGPHASPLCTLRDGAHPTKAEGTPQRGPTLGDTAEGTPRRRPGGGDPARLPDHGLGDGLGARRHLDALLPLLPPGIGQDVVLVGAQLEGVRDLHGRYQIRTENLHRKKKKHPTGRVKGSGRGRVHARPGRVPWGIGPQGTAQRVPAFPTVRLRGVTSCHLRGEVWVGEQGAQAGTPLLGQAAPRA